MNNLSRSKIHYLILIAIVVVGGYLRFAHLGAPSFWVDEMNHVIAAKSMMNGGEAQLLSGQPYTRSILFTKMVQSAFSIFGVNEFSARLPSAFWGTLVIGLLFLIGSMMFQRKDLGLVAAFLYAFNPFMIGWARECRMYTMFQFFFLLSVMALYLGFEKVKYREKVVSNLKEVLFNLLNFNFLWLLIGIISFLIATSLHILSGTWLPAFLVFSVLVVLKSFLNSGIRAVYSSKYFMVFIAIIIFALLGKILFPDLYLHIIGGLNFAPNWAQYNYVQNPFYYYQYLTSSFYFSISAFFLLGLGLLVYRLSREGYYLLLNFIIPFFMLSFLFTVHIDRYIYHLYPFYLMIAGIGIIELFHLLGNYFQNIFPFKVQVIKKINPVLVSCIISIFFVAVLGASDWFRFSRKIPFLSYGTNGAVEHFEWRDAVNFLKEQASEDDLIISTLPLTVHYYFGRADYFLASLKNPRPDEVYESPTGKRDTYSNARVIDTLDDLKKVASSNPTGWIIVDNYRFEQERYVRKDLVQYVKANLKLIYSSMGRTISIYAWE